MDHRAAKKAGMSAAGTISGSSTSRPSAFAARKSRWSEATSALTADASVGLLSTFLTYSENVARADAILRPYSVP